jgi:uncharacterized membrane protein
MQENLILTGILLVFIGILLIFIGAVLGSKEVKTEWGFFGLIGPIPIGAWSSMKVFVLTIIISMLFMVLVFAFIKKW